MPATAGLVLAPMSQLLSDLLAPPDRIGLAASQPVDTTPVVAHGEPDSAALAASPEVLLEQLFRRLEAPMTNVLYRWLWDREEVQDVVQEAFLRLWRMRSRVDWDRAEPLVYKIALNLAASRRRRHKLWRLVGIEHDPGSAAEPTASADAKLERLEAERAVKRALDALPERQRRVLVLSAFSDLSYEAIATALGISPGTVASRRHAAIRKVRDSLQRWETTG